MAHCPTCTCKVELSDPDENTIGAFHSEPQDTEADAAFRIYPTSGTKRRIVLDAIAEAGDHGLTDVEVAERTKMHFQTSQPRRHELMRGGWVEDSGQRRETGKGGTAIVWVLTDQGRAEYAGDAPVSRRRRIVRTPRALNLPAPRTVPSKKSPAEDRPPRKTRTRGASSTGTGRSKEEIERARDRVRARNAAKSAGT